MRVRMAKASGGIDGVWSLHHRIMNVLLMLPIVDRLFSRIGTCDSIESNSSSFMIEMKDMAFILQVCRL